MSSLFKRAFIIYIHAILVCGFSIRTVHGQERPDKKEPEVRSFFGIVHPFRQVTLSARYDDLIVIMNVEEGDEVSKGDVIAQQEYLIRDFAVKQIENSANDTTNLEIAQVTSDILERAYRRSEALVKTDADESGAAYDRALLDWKKAKISVEAAKHELERLALTLKARKQELEYTKIITPISGIVVNKYHEVGETVDYQTRRIVDIINIETVLIEVNLPAEMLTKITLGDNVKVRIPVLGKREFDGNIYRISSIVDPKSNFFQVKVNVKNPVEPYKSPPQKYAHKPTKDSQDQQSDSASKDAKENAANLAAHHIFASGIQAPRPPRRKHKFLIKPGLTAEVIFTLK